MACLDTHITKNRPEGGLERADRIIHHVPGQHHIPFQNCGHESLGELIQLRKVTGLQPLALENSELLLHLMHPRAVDRQEETRHQRR